MRFIAVATALTLASSLSIVSPVRGDTLDKIKSSHTIILGYTTDAPPFSFLGSDGQPQGFSVDLCQRVVAATKLAIKADDLMVKYVPVRGEERLTKLESGEIDIECGTSTRTLSREARVDFTLFTFITGTELLVPLHSDIYSAADLGGKKIAVMPGTTTYDVITNILKDRLTNGTVVSVKDNADGLKAVKDGRADAYASDEVILIGVARNAEDPAFYRLSGTMYSYEPYAFMVRQNDAAFRLIANRALAQIYRSGQIWDIYKHWFSEWRAKPSAILTALYAIQSLSD